VLGAFYLHHDESVLQYQDMVKAIFEKILVVIA